MFVCLCNGVTDHQIKEAVDVGVTTFESMQQHLSVSTVCGSCSCEVKSIIEKKLSHTVANRSNAIEINLFSSATA